MSTPRRTPRVPSIGFCSAHDWAAASRSVSVASRPGGGLLHQQLLDRRQELVQRRVEQADGDRQAVHGVEDLEEVGLLGGPQLARARPPPRRACRRGSSPARSAGGPRRGTCARCGTGRCPRRRSRGRPWRRRRCRRWPARRACPSGCGRPSRGSRRTPPGGSASASAMAPSTTSPVVPSSEMVSPSATVTPPAVNVLAADLHRLGADDGGDAPAAGDDGGVAHQAARAR